MTNEEYLSVRDIASRLSKTYETVWRYIKAGDLPSVKVGNSRLVRAEDFEKWIRERTHE